MDFVRYAERSAGLVNADLGDTEHLLHFLDEREWLHDAVSERDAGALRRFVQDLRPVFEASNAGDEQGVVELAQRPARQAPGHAVHRRARSTGPDRWHLHVADRRVLGVRSCSSPSP